MTDVQTMVSEAIQEMEEDQKELQQKIKYVKDFDFSVPVTEEQWHQICETPLRWTDVMAHLVKNRFPNAEHIKVTANDVVFDLEGFDPVSSRYVLEAVTPAAVSSQNPHDLRLSQRGQLRFTAL